MPRLTAPSNIPTLNRTVQRLETFRGVDFTTSPTEVDVKRSPDAPNMTRDVPGMVRKRMGYQLIETYPAEIFGVHVLKATTETQVVHAGDKLYTDPETVIYTGMAENLSISAQLDGSLYILDGQKILCYGEFDGSYQVKPLTEIATVPTIVISRSPTGGGTSFEPVNLLQSKWTESFLGTANTTTYQLSFGELDSTAVTAKKLDSNGDWVNLTEGTDFTVDRTTGVVTFSTAPGASPITGEDNVEITASRDWGNYSSRINQCNIACLFGVAGASDRLFVSGNSEYKNYDWYSQQNDPTYFGDTWYSILGQDESPITGYGTVGSFLVTFKNGSQEDKNVYIRTSQLIDGQAAFPIYSALQGQGAIAPYAMGYLSTEPLFLTTLGVYAITAQDVTGEKYTQSRSYYLNGQLLKEANLKNAVALVWKDFYVLAINGNVYLLDGLQVAYEKNAPYSKYQYEGYFWNNVPANVLYEKEGALCFGDNQGNLYQFYQDVEDGNSYNDNGQAIDAYWTFPAFYGKDFYKKKTFRYIAVQVAPAPVTSVKVWAFVRGVWELIQNETGKTRYFKWSTLSWDKFSWNTDTTPRSVGIKIKIKKVDKTIFKLENDQLNEPFGFYGLSIEFTEQGYYKR